jgi:predicted  nucleic acid-binding Zn-ribbon protein
MKTFREIKDLEYQIQQLKDDLKEADFCIDYLQGKVLLRDNEIIALRNKIQDLQK